MNNFASYINKISAVSEETLSLLQSSFVYDELKKADYFVREGVHANEIAFLETGVVRAFYVDRLGKEYNKTFFVAPAIIGSYASLINKEKNRLPQQALTDCIVWRMPFDEIEKLSETSLEMERLRRKVAEQFFLGNEKKELEMALLEAKERYLIFQNEYPGLEDSIPQYHVASYLGISPTQLSRIRKASD